MILGEKVEFRIEVEDAPKSVLLVLDRKCDHCVVPFEVAERLAGVIDRVIEDVRCVFTPTSLFVTEREQSQVKIGHGDGLVGFFIEWTDRLRFTSLDALHLVARAIRLHAQDARLALSGVHMRYGKDGMLRKIHNARAGTTQHVR